MKKSKIMFVALLWSVMFSCQPETPVENEILLADVAAKLNAAGFDTSEGLSQFKDGYLVEYDIFLRAEEIDELSESILLSKNANEEHYRTNNLVNMLNCANFVICKEPYVVHIAIDPAFDFVTQNNLDLAIARYNAVATTQIRFKKTSFSPYAPPGGKGIKILPFYEDSGLLGFSDGFPRNGKPAPLIYLNTRWFNSANPRQDAVSTIAHEIGHCIGFRHTDYMNSVYSCGQVGGNEGPGTVGAVHIAGTPTGPENNSFMLACVSGVDRPFTANDVTAIGGMYPLPSSPWPR